MTSTPDFKGMARVAINKANLITIDGEFQDTLFACVDKKISTKVFLDALDGLQPP